MEENFYYLKGALKPNEVSYIERQADNELMSAIMNEKLCMVVAPPAMWQK